MATRSHSTSVSLCPLEERIRHCTQLELVELPNVPPYGPLFCVTVRKQTSTTHAESGIMTGSKSVLTSETLTILRDTMTAGRIAKGRVYVGADAQWQYERHLRQPALCRLDPSSPDRPSGLSPLSSRCKDIAMTISRSETSVTIKMKGVQACATCVLPMNKVYKCAHCLTVAYCSKPCQRADWKRHKPNCGTIDPSHATNRSLTKKITRIIYGGEKDVHLSPTTQYYLDFMHCVIPTLHLHLLYQGDASISLKQMTALLEKGVSDAWKACRQPKTPRASKNPNSVLQWRWEIPEEKSKWGSRTSHPNDSGKELSDCSLSIATKIPGSIGVTVDIRPRRLGSTPLHHFLDHNGVMREEGWRPTPPPSIAAFGL